MNLNLKNELNSPIGLLLQDHAKAVKRICSTIPSFAGQGVLNRRFLSYRVELAPGIYSDDPRYPSFIKLMQQEMSRNFEVSNISEDGLFVGPPVVSDFSEIKTQAGSMRLPLFFNAGVESVDLPKYMVEAFSELKTLYRLYKDESRHARIVAKTNRGAPYFDVNPHSSIKHLDFIAHNISEFRDAIMEDDYVKLFDRFRVLILNHNQIRLQNDSWKDGKPKKREGYSYIGCLTGGKTFEPTAVNEFGLAINRTRPVVASPKILNNIGSELLEPYRKGFETRFKKTYKEITLADQVNQAKKYQYVVGIDVAQFDSKLPLNVIELLMDQLDYPFIKELAKKLLYAPLYSSDPYGLGVALCNGNPLKGLRDDLRIYRGLTSGIFCTSFASKHTVPVYLYSIFKHNGLIKGSLEEFLDWKLDIAICNMGDDTKIHFNDKKVLEFIKGGGLTTNVLEIELEDGLKYCGILSWRDGEGNIRCSYNLSSYLRFWIAEKSYNSKVHPYKLFGRAEASGIDMYGSHPYFDRVREIEYRIVKDIFKIDMASVIKNAPRPKIEDSLTTADLEVIIDKNKIFYKYDLDEINSGIIDDYLYVVDDSTSTMLREGLKL